MEHVLNVCIICDCIIYDWLKSLPPMSMAIHSLSREEHWETPHSLRKFLLAHTRKQDVACGSKMCDTVLTPKLEILISRSSPFEKDGLDYLPA